MCLWQNLVAFEVQVHLRRQGLTSPSEGEGFTLPSEVDGENEDENENEEEQDEDDTVDWGGRIEEKFCIFLRYRLLQPDSIIKKILYVLLI